MGLFASGPLSTPLVELTRELTPMMPILALMSTPNQPMFIKLLSSTAPMMAANMPKHQTTRGAEGTTGEEDVRLMARKLDPPNPAFNQGLHLCPKLRDLRVGECPGNSTNQTGDAKIVDTAHTSGVPAVHD